MNGEIININTEFDILHGSENAILGYILYLCWLCLYLKEHLINWYLIVLTKDRNKENKQKIWYKKVNPL